MTSPRALIRCERGVAAVEFGLVGLLLITVTVGILEVGRALFFYNELGYAADRAARVVMLDFDIAEADLATAVRDADRLTALTPDAIGVAAPTPATTDAFRTLELSFPFTPMLTGLTIDAVTLTASRRVPR